MGHDPRAADLRVEELLQHEAWLRRVVHALLGRSAGIADADDVLQQTWLAALQARQARRRAPLHAWLALVAKNHARREVRNARRRRRREERAARPEALPSEQDAVELLALRREVLDAVLALPEPYRAAVLLRYVHDADFAAIAARTATGEANVRQRVSRGLQMVRDRLAARSGAGWRDRLALLVPLGMRATGASSALPFATGVLSMSKHVQFAAVLLLSLVVFGAAWLLRAPAATGALSPRAHVAAATTRAEPPPADAGAVPLPREALTPQLAAADAAPALLHGRVLDASGAPVGGVTLQLRTAIASERARGGQRPEAFVEPTVWLDAADQSATTEAPPPLAESDAHGRFALVVPEPAGALVGAGPYATLRAWPVRSADTRRDDVLLVVAPAASYRGTVCDADGRPLEGVLLHVTTPPLAGFPEVLDHAAVVGYAEARSAADGTFAVDGLPGGHARLSFTKEGFVPAEFLVPAGGRVGETVVLRARDEAAWRVSGRVLDHAGSAVAGAAVAFGGKTVHSDADGAFALSFLEPTWRGSHTRSRLFAAKPGLRTKVIADAAQRLAVESDRALEIDLRFDGEALSIAGRVQRDDGSAWPGVHVFPHQVEDLLEDEASAEDLACGEAEELLRVGRRAVRAHARTDADGRFELRGLDARDYRLRVFDPHDLVVDTTEAIAAGSRDVVIRVPASAVFNEISGRVVAPNGEPLAGVGIRMLVYAYQSARDYRGGAPVAWRDLGQSDTDGRFVLRRVPSEAQIDFAREDTAGRGYFAERLAAGEQEVVLPRMCHFRLALHGALARAVAAEFSDAGGNAVWVRTASAGGTSYTRTCDVRDGATPVLAVSETAASLHLRGPGGKTLATLPVKLVPGGVNVLQ